MIKLTSFNNNFFRNHKNLVLVTTCIIGTLVVNIPKDRHLPNFKKEIYYSFEESNPRGTDKYVWKEYTSDLTDVQTMTYYPSDSYKLRVFRGSSGSNYYRILVYSNSTYKCSEWQEIPDNDLIVIKHDDYDSQYGNEFRICFGTYNLKTGTIEETGDEKIVFNAESSAELVEKFNLIRENALAEVKKTINYYDTDFIKVKKVYDYVISHFAYFHNPVSLNFEEDVYQDLFGVWYLDCAGYADILNYILNSLGIESFTVVCDTWGHVWNIVKVDDCYYHVDACYSDTGSWNNTSKYRFFLVSDDFMLQDNRWFTPEKNVVCPKTYDLTGLVNEEEVEYRGLK